MAARKLKKLLLIIGLLIVPCGAFAEGPRFQHKDPFVQQEVENIYQDIRGSKSTANDLNDLLTTNTSGQMLVGQGSSAMPKWTNMSEILNVKQYTITATTATTVDVRFVSTSLTGSITPSATSSKILMWMNSRSANNTASSACFYGFFRNGSLISGASGSTFHQGAANTSFPIAMAYMDSPASASALTYTVAFLADTGTTCTMGLANLTSTLILLEVRQ